MQIADWHDRADCAFAFELQDAGRAAALVRAVQPRPASA